MHKILPDLAVGDETDVRDPPAGWHVIVVAHDVATSTSHYPLRDGVWNDPGLMLAAAIEAVTVWKRRPVLICCQAGVSRSTTIAAMAIARRRGWSFDRAVEVVRQAYPGADPHPVLQEVAREALKEKKP